MTLFNTNMALNIKGIDVKVIAGSPHSGRIFFGGAADHEVYELTYQQEEKWFASKCGKINHTSPGYTSLIPTWTAKATEHVVDILIDDTRALLYTLSSASTVRIFHMDTEKSLKLMVQKTRETFLAEMSHMISQSQLFDSGMQIISLSTIPSTESERLHLLATTANGCRLYLSATRGYGYLANHHAAPTSLAVQHVKFPPPDRDEPRPPRSPAGPTGWQMDQVINTNSRSLVCSEKAVRYPPGYWMAFVTKDKNLNESVAFISAPDTGRITAEAREVVGQSSKYYEHGFWLELDSHVEDIGMITKGFAAANTPTGFGNELAVQFDEPAPEIAILTNTGITTIRRRRLVDIFAAAIKMTNADQGNQLFERELAHFVRHYGRSEAAAAALAVACGQGADISAGDMRTAKVFDPAVLDAARKAFIDHGGRPSVNTENIADGEPLINHVRPSARHEGLAIYIARLVRSLWRSTVMTETISNGVVVPRSTIGTEKLRHVQDDIKMLDNFLKKNKTFIQGLTGPEALQRGATKQDEIALQGEHQALHSLWNLIVRINEGISFVTMLFEERMGELWSMLDDTTRQQFRELTYESLFTADEGKSLGKILVKVIVNINIAAGANVETVADTLRDKCGSFCSADDVVIFKAQELLKKASEQGPTTDTGRGMLQQSLIFFEKVAKSLTAENLQSIIEQYVEMSYYAGAIALCLRVAFESDKGSAALSWMNDGKPENDPRERQYVDRKRCYELIHRIMEHLDQASAHQPEYTVDGNLTVMAKKRSEAYMIINESDDEVFHYDLYEWYLSEGWVDRLLNTKSPFVEPFLEQLSKVNIQGADLLWRFYASRKKYYQAGQVQHTLAKSTFDLPLKARVEYLSQAKANTATTTIGVSRALQVQLNREVSILLEIANIQDEILQRIQTHPLISPAQMPEIIKQLDGQILPLEELFNGYADQAGYFDLSLIIMQAGDYTGTGEITATWNNLIKATHDEIEARNQTASGSGERPPQPYEAVINIVKNVAYRLNRSEIIFSPEIVIPLLEKYCLEDQKDVGPPTWVMDLFIDIEVGYERIVQELEKMIHNPVAPFDGRNSKYIKRDMLYVIGQWYNHCIRHNEDIFGGSENVFYVTDLLMYLTSPGSGLDAAMANEARELRVKIDRALRR